MASMVFQSFGVPTPAIESMLSMIQNMIFYLWTGYGNSSGYADRGKGSSGESMKMQGMCQGNGASQAAWRVTSIPMIAAQRRKDHGAHFIAPITNKAGHLIGGSFMDDMDLFHLEMRVNKTVHQAHSRLQDGIIN